MSKEKDTSSHYVNNKEFFSAMKEWKVVVNEALESGEPKPPVTDYIGDCFLKIAEHLSYRPNFINYPYREEMVGDGIENCLMYASNFDPDKSDNPFSYFTQIVYYAFLRRIQKEKKQDYVKYRCFEIMDDNGVIPDDFKVKIQQRFDSSKNPYANMFRLSETDIENFTPKKKKKKRKKKESKSSLDSVLDEDKSSEDSTDK
tara:strand:+ start:678 stop:1280 length:603 start_codon:yes stop_codon:yes gene_type:complete